MRLHTDLEYDDIVDAVSDLPGVFITVSQHGSRSRPRAFEVMLEGNGYYRNTGTSGADSQIQAATWDEWGVFLAILYDRDPSMVCGSIAHPTYRDAEDYEFQTQGRFTDLTMPEDTHKRHDFSVVRLGGLGCSKCSAVKGRRGGR